MVWVVVEELLVGQTDNTMYLQRYPEEGGIIHYTAHSGRVPRWILSSRKCENYISRPSIRDRRRSMDIRILIIIAAIWVRDNKSLGGIPNITFVPGNQLLCPLSSSSPECCKIQQKDPEGHDHSIIYGHVIVSNNSNGSFRSAWPRPSVLELKGRNFGTATTRAEQP